jgi:aldehyde dehydrogenase
MSSVQPISVPNYGLKQKYGNYIGGQWVAPTDGEYFENISPVNGKPMTMVPRSQAADIELALDAAHEAAPAWGKTSVTERSSILLKIADRMEENLEMLATVETWDNGKSIRETMAADLPLAIDHFRYFAGVIRAEAGEVSNIDANTVSMEVHEPLGVVGQIIPWNFPILMATWKLAPFSCSQSSSKTCCHRASSISSTGSARKPANPLPARHASARSRSRVKPQRGD